MLDLLLATLISPQQPEAKPVPAQTIEAAAPRQPATAWDDKKAKAALDELAKGQKAGGNLAQRLAALDAIAGGSNAQLVKPLVKIVETEKSIVVQKRAALLLGDQPPATANTALRKLLKHPKVVGAPAVTAQVVRSIADCGYTKAQWDEIEPLFERDYEPDNLVVHVAVLELATRHKEAKALPLLLRNLDEPVPHDVDAAHNPPAEYWKARWNAWAAWRDRVKEALLAITGQRFGSAAEAQAWLDKNPMK